MAIERVDPFRDLGTLRDLLNSVFQEGPLRNLPVVGNLAFVPVDLVENEQEFTLKASLPGVKPEDVHITVHGDTLTIRGEFKAEEEKKGDTWHLKERRAGQFQRNIALASSINADKARAEFKDGVLTLVLPKAEEARPKQIKINTSPVPKT
jgi:HSP20 family protein